MPGRPLHWEYAQICDRANLPPTPYTLRHNTSRVPTINTTKPLSQQSACELECPYGPERTVGREAVQPIRNADAAHLCNAYDLINMTPEVMQALNDDIAAIQPVPLYMANLDLLFYHMVNYVVSYAAMLRTTNL